MRPGLQTAKPAVIDIALRTLTGMSIHISVKSKRIYMKLCSNVCNRCRLVCVKFYLNRSRFAVVVAKCYGAHFFWDTR